MNDLDGLSGTADSARMWITAVPAFDPDDVGVLLAVDTQSQDPGERMVCVLLNRGHEGEAGVFYLLPSDLSARYERMGDRLAVSVTAFRQGLVDNLAQFSDSVLEHLAGLARDPADDDRVLLLRREIVTDFVPAEQDGEKQPVLVLDHMGGPAALTELFSRFAQGDASIGVLHADRGTDAVEAGP
ncbi:hypothetical protein [Streptomyces sp. NPDC056165]|uniref:hypothetical protein n=1 Tax=Streptomyces sp. NPDC056165 TaxID=3345733 RepID=UPI0035DFC6B3